MTERTRAHLRQEFQDGERPSGNDFADAWDSFLSKQDDGLTVDTANDDTLVLNRGMRIGNSIDATPGTLRFNAGNLQIHDGAGFQDVGAGGGGGGAFQVQGADAVYTAGGNVGVGPAFAGAAPAFRLEVEIGQNTGTSEQVRFGEAVIHRGTGAQGSSAHFSHRNRASNQEYALRQRATGEVNVNSPNNTPIFFSQGGTAAGTRMTIAPGGQVLVATPNTLTAAANTRLHVGGDAIKSAGGGNWSVPSDARLKDEVEDYTTGLSAVRRVRPVSFRYNGKCGTIEGTRSIGVIGQEIENVLPETVTRVARPAPGNEASDLADLRIYDGNALTYALVNAIKELADRVEALEARLAREGN